MSYNSDIEYLKKYIKEENKDNAFFEEAVNKLKHGLPIQYIIGNVNFYGNIINVNDKVLIPRYETELLVEKAINLIRKKFNNQFINIIDIGTGSGCIAITLKKELDANITAIDISKEALDVARSNAQNNNVIINFVEADMTHFDYSKYEVIISNPPYIRYDEEIMDVVKNNEPYLALYASDNGLYFYRKILEQVTDNNKLICFEIGEAQGDAIKEMAHDLLGDVIVSVIKDYSDKDRFVFIERKD